MTNPTLSRQFAYIWVRIASWSLAVLLLTLLFTFAFIPTPSANAAPVNSPATKHNGSAFSGTVLADILYVFQGPGINYPITAYAYAGETLWIESQSDQCEWLLVRTINGDYGWVNGWWLKTNFYCSELGSGGSPQPTPTPKPKSISFSQFVGQGCYLFQNYAGVDVTVTIWPKNNAWSKAIFVAKGTDVQECFDAQRYNYRLEAAGLVSESGELNIKMGKHYEFPIWAK